MSSIVFFGTEDFSLASLQALIDADFDIELVVTKPDTPKGRHGTPTPPPVKELAQQYSIRTLQPASTNELVKGLANIESNHGVVVAYGRILPKSVLDIFSGGLYNVHASLLPRWRGASPIEQAILHGDSETGVTIMLLNEGMDTGPMYTKVVHPLNGDEYQQDLYKSLARLGAECIVPNMQKVLRSSSDDLNFTEQDDNDATYAPMLSKVDGKLDFTKSAVELERQVRAYSVWPTSYFELNNLRIVLKNVSLSEVEGAPGKFSNKGELLLLHCAAGSLQVESLIIAGRTEISAKEFISGYNRLFQAR